MSNAGGRFCFSCCDQAAGELVVKNIDQTIDTSEVKVKNQSFSASSLAVAETAVDLDAEDSTLNRQLGKAAQVLGRQEAPSPAAPEIDRPEAPVVAEEPGEVKVEPELQEVNRATVEETEDVVIDLPPQEKLVEDDCGDRTVGTGGVTFDGGKPDVQELAPADRQDARKKSFTSSNKDPVHRPSQSGSNLTAHEETLTTRALYAYGSMVGRYPHVACCVAFIAMAIIVPLGLRHLKSLGGEGVYYQKSFEFLWSKSGGLVEENLQLKADNRKDIWGGQGGHTVMAIGKEAYKGKDIVNKDGLAELQPILKAWGNITVEVDGLTYTTFDLCYRLLMPDMPRHVECPICPLSFPCQIVTPHLCFTEFMDALSPEYKALDMVLPLLPQFKGFGIANFTMRPSYKNMNPQQVKAEVTKERPPYGNRGCPHFVESSVVGPQFWAGRPKPPWGADSTYLDSADGMRMLLDYDSVGAIAYRMSVIKPKHANQDKVERAVELHTKKFHDFVVNYNKDPDVKFLEITNYKPDALSEVMDEAEKPEVLLIVMGLVLLVVYVTVNVAHISHPFQSRINMAWTGLLLIVVSVCITFCLFLACGRKLNVAVVSGCPLLQLGLGADDMFVLISYFNGLGEDFIREKDYPTILGELFMRCGLGVLLTSSCNAIAFACGSFIPVAGLSAYCVAISLGAVVNFFVDMTLFLPCIVLEARRIKQGRPEVNPFVYFCQKRRLDVMKAEGSFGPMTSAEIRKSKEHGHQQSRTEMPARRRCCHDCLQGYARFLLRWPVKIAMTVVSFGFFGGMVGSITNKTIGYEPWILVKEENPTRRALEMIFGEFQLYVIKVYFRPEVDPVRNQKEMYLLYDKLSKTEFTTPASRGILSQFIYRLHIYQDTPIQSVSAFYDPTNTSRTYGDLGWKPRTGEIDTNISRYGLAPSDPKIFYDAYNDWAPIPLDNPWQAYGQSMGTLFMFFYGSGHTSTTFDDQGNIKWMSFSLYTKGLYDEDDYVKCLEDLHEIVDASPLKDKVFLYSNVLIYWETFRALDDLTWILIGSSIGCIALVTLALLQSFRGAIVAMFVSGMIVIELYGFCMIFLQFNPFVIVAMAAGVGLSVEVVSHTIAAFFLEASGSLEERLGQAMKCCFVPNVHGSVSTALAILPLAWAEIEFIAWYQCYPILIVIAVGCLNGLVFLPSKLGLTHCD